MIPALFVYFSLVFLFMLPLSVDMKGYFGDSKYPFGFELIFFGIPIRKNKISTNKDKKNEIISLDKAKNIFNSDIDIYRYLPYSLSINVAYPVSQSNFVINTFFSSSFGILYVVCKKKSLFYKYRSGCKYSRLQFFIF